MPSNIRFKSPQAYRDLGISFFLHLTPEAADDLAKHHVRQTRRLHPDLLPMDASDDEREESESRLSALNSAFLRLRDTDSRLDLVIHQILEDNPGLKDAAKPEMPAQLAMEYFELQEALEEKPGDEATLAAIKEFTGKVTAEVRRISQEIEALCASMYIASISSADDLANENSPKSSLLSLSASEAEVTKLLSLRSRERYLRRLKDDLLGVRSEI